MDDEKVVVGSTPVVPAVVGANDPGPTTEPPTNVECPKCGHKFWHKVGDAIKKVGEGAVEVAGDVLAGGAAKDE